jgi:hypothetical protein
MCVLLVVTFRKSPVNYQKGKFLHELDTLSQKYDFYLEYAVSVVIERRTRCLLLLTDQLEM